MKDYEVFNLAQQWVWDREEETDESVKDEYLAKDAFQAGFRKALELIREAYEQDPTESTGSLLTPFQDLIK